VRQGLSGCHFFAGRQGMWEWQERNFHGDVWIPYEDTAKIQLESAFRDASQEEVLLEMRGRTYIVSLTRMLQTNPFTHFQRHVRRGPANGERVMLWEWESDSGWSSFDRRAAAQLDAAMSAQRPVTVLHLEQYEYQIDLSRMQQTNTRTHKSRAIRRVEASHKSSLRPSLPLYEFFDMSGAMDLPHVTGWKVLKRGEWAEGAEDPITFQNLGEDDEEVVRLPCHTESIPCTFNRSTLEQAFASSNKCPTCTRPYPLRGPQPSGEMHVSACSQSCVGHERSGTLVLRYVFPNGVQAEQHPEPGNPYHGTQRQCVYPDNIIGWNALELLRRAFRSGLLFRVGSSATTGRQHAVVWSIHQKTRLDGGPTQHGWPDESFLDRLRSELASAGMPIEDMSPS